jgi:hypothetical protein
MQKTQLTTTQLGDTGLRCGWEFGWEGAGFRERVA